MSPGVSKRRMRIIVAVATLALAFFLVALFQKPTIVNALRPGDTVQIEFPRDYKLEVDNSDVKMSGTPVGKVSGVERTDHGTIMVTTTVENGVLDKLGSAPSASIRPTTVLGGKYYVDLKSGGTRGTFNGGAIPPQRTQTPVELDKMLRALPSSVRTSMRGVISKLDQTLGSSKDSLRAVLANAPSTLTPAGSVLRAARGTRPSQDLSNLVTDLDSAANVLSRRNGQLATVVDSFKGTTGGVSDAAKPLAHAIGNLPDALHSLRNGAQDLGGTLDKVETTASNARPAVKELDPLLQKLDPVLAQTRPLLADLRPALNEARPMVRNLVPVARQGTSVLGDLEGPVMERVKGPIVHTLMKEWHGKPPKYPHGGGNGHTMYQEVGYMFALLNEMTEHQDPSGTFLSFQFGVAPNSVVNAPAGIDYLLEGLSKLMGPPKDQRTSIDSTDLVPGSTHKVPPTRHQGILPGLWRGQPPQNQGLLSSPLGDQSPQQPQKSFDTGGGQR